MSEPPASEPRDPFQTPVGFVAALARRIGTTEGQLYSLLIAVVFIWAVLANGLPQVVWDPADQVPPDSPFAIQSSAPTGDEPASLAQPPAPAPVPDLPPSDPLAPAPSRGQPSTNSEPVGSGSPGTAPTDTGTGGEPRPGAAGPPPEAAGPPRVTGGGYASADAGTPLATIGVPEGSVAVARRGGEVDKVAYLRVAGVGTTLELAVDPDGANILDALAELQLCVISESDWEVGHGAVAPGDAPKFDCEEAVDGARSEEGDSWTFNVGSIDLTAVPGVALVPADTMGPQFQVVFRIGEPPDAQTAGKRREDTGS